MSTSNNNTVVKEEDVAQLVSMGYDIDTARSTLMVAGGYYELALNHLQQPPSGTANNNPDDVQTLVGMGFAKEQAQQALQQTGRNVEQALNLLLSGGVTAESGATSNNNNNSKPPSSIQNPIVWAATATQNWAAKEITNHTFANNGVVQGQFHQYSIHHQEGRSACTCIALTAASIFLHKTHLSQNTIMVTQYFLAQMIARGIEHYQDIQKTSSSTTAVEHMSAEEVLQQPKASQEIFGNLHLMDGGVRQGMLSHDEDHPMGLKSLLEGLLQEHQQAKQGDDEYLCVLITKTPETVLVCLPLDASTNRFWLIDSHPRPQFGLSSSYAKFHSSLDDLLLSLYSLFVPTGDLGPDIPEMMAMMYNSFDLYPFVHHQK